MARTKGSQNKFNKSMKDALELAFERSGGVDYLVHVAGEDPKTFCGLRAFDTCHRRYRCNSQD